MTSTAAASIDLAVTGGTVVTPRGRFQAAIGIKDGRITAVCAEAHLPPAAETLDARGLYVLPGLIDDHVHFREPGMTYKEDFATGSRAAAASGVTMVVDMPNGTNPPLTTLDSFREKVGLVQDKAMVDFGLIAAVVPQNLGEIHQLAEAGVVGFKIFMGETVGAIETPDDGTMLEAYHILAKTGRRMATHAENDPIIQHLTARYRAEGRQGIAAHIAARPVVAEVEAVQRAILFAETAGAKLQILHMSSRQAVEVARQAKRRGVHLTVETCPHYLLFSSEDIERVGNIVKMNPPVRGGEHPQALWEGLLDGTIDIIGTDHSPHTPEEKLREDIWEVIPGWTGIETTNPLMLTEVNRGRLTLEHFVRVRSENPARAFDLYPRKGSLQIGADADITLVDMGRQHTIAAAGLESKSKITPFEGRRVQGMAVATIVRGRIVMRDGEIIGPPTGRLVSPGPAGSGPGDGGQ